MSNQTNAEYFAARALVERGLSNSVAHARAAAAHAELADRYEALALQFRAPAKGRRLELVRGGAMAAALLEPGAADAPDQRY